MRPKKKMRLREKRRRIKKTVFVVELKTHKRKSDSEERLSSKVLNANIVVRPASGLSNTSSKTESGSSNGELEESGYESMVMMCDIFIGLFCIFPCLSTFLGMINAVTLKLLDIYSSVNFETILWTAKERVVFKINLNKNNCDCFPTLLGLQGWVHSMECQVIFLIRTGIYLLAPMALGGMSVCHYQLKYLCCCLIIVL